MSAGRASIDDLLQYEDETPRRPRRDDRSGRFWWLRTVLSAAGLTAVTVVGLRLAEVGISIIVVYAAFLTLLLLRRITTGLAPPPRSGRRRRLGPAEPGPDDWAARDALCDVVRQWETKLAWSRGEPDRFARGAWSVLGELVDERLRQRHGLTRASAPDRARRLVGEPVWIFLARPPKRPPAPRDLAVIVAELEKI